MADKKNVLVFPAGTEIAFEIHQALRRSKFVRLFGATSVPCHAEFVFERCFEGLPFADDPALIDALNRIIDENAIDYIYPAHDSALLTLTRARGALHAKVVTSDPETVEICEALDEALADGTDYAICEYLPGEEFTVDCFTDRHGALRLVSPRSRDRIRAGIAVRTRPFPADARIRAIAEDLNRRLSFNGAWFFQLKENAAGDYRLMEAAPRVAGTMGATRNLGYNLPLLTLYNHWGFDVELLGNDNEELLDRAFISRFSTDISYEKVYVDFDDTLIVDGKVNSELIGFLYQARNKGKRVVLLSRHDTELLPDLERFAISPALFDEIIRLGRDDDKTRFIGPDSIFIDDSFAERRRVKESCGIPVFDLDMVESLLDWRM